jgi:hypothetical protein
MDSDNEEEQMFAELFEEEMAAAAQDEEHMLILACMYGLYAEKTIGCRGGSAPGHRKCKPRQRIEAYCILYADYFADSPLHGEAVFRCPFRMSDGAVMVCVINEVNDRPVRNPKSKV